MKRSPFATIIAACIFFLFNCSDSSIDNQTESFINSDKEITNESEENKAKVKKLAEFINDAVLEGNTNKYLSKFDLDYFTDKLVSSLKMSSRKKAGFAEGLKKGIITFPKQIMSYVENGALYEAINCRFDTSKNAYFMLFRLYSEESGINYHDYRVSKIGNDFMFCDMYIYLTGENISQTMQRMVMNSLPSNKLLEILKPEKKEDFNKIVAAGKFMKTGQYEEAYTKYNSLEGSMKDEKFTLIMKSQAASMFSSELYQESMDALMQKYPNDNSLSLSFIDYYLLKEDYNKTLEMTNRLKKETGDDFLQYMIGNIHYMKKDYNAAKINYKYIMENYEDFHSSYFSYMVCLAKSKKYKETVAVLNKLSTFDYSKFELIDYVETSEVGIENEFEDFMKSKEYKIWKKK